MLRHFKYRAGPASARTRRDGFTLIELMVSISIVAIILTVLVSNQSTYTDGAALTNLADEISSRVAQAQAYGIGVKEFSSGTSDFNAAYGLAFSIPGAGPTAYVSFADRNANKIYDDDWSCPIGGASECLEKINISRGNSIESLCIVLSSGPDDCDVARVDISFLRPNTTAQLIFFSDAGDQVVLPGAIGAKIILRSPAGSGRSVVVYETGQTSVQIEESTYPSPTPYGTPYDTPYDTPYGTPYGYQTPAVFYDLTASKAGTGTGTIIGNGISCADACAGPSTVSLAENTVVSLGAAPTSGHTFVGWSGSCSGTGTCDTTMTSAKSVTATFNASPTDTTPPVVTAFDVQPRTASSSVKATFTVTDAGGSHLKNANLMRATANATCTISIDTGCTWSTVATSNAGINATMASPVNVSVSTNNITKNAGANVAFNAGAISAESIASGDGYVEFSTNERHVKTAGLGYGNTDQGSADLDYAVYLADNQANQTSPISIYESNVSKGIFGTYLVGDTFRVAVVSGAVKYYKNGVLLYTSTKAPTYPLTFDSSLFYLNDTFTKIVVSSAVSDSWTGTLFDTPTQGNYYVYGLQVNDNNSPTPNMGVEPVKILVTATTPKTFPIDTGSTLPNNLMAYWKFDEVSGNRSDSKGASTLVDNNTVTSNAGIRGNAAHFTAANTESLSRADNAALSTGGTSYSIAGWVYLDTKNTYQTIIDKYQTATSREYWVGYDTSVDRFNYYLYNAAGTRVGYVAANNFGAISTGAWYFLYIEYNSTNGTVGISVNNGALDTDVVTGVPGDTTAGLYIGSDGTSKLNGSLDEFGFWKRVLTPQERTDLYNAGAGNTYIP